MRFDQFHNMLRIMMNLDRPDLEAGGIKFERGEWEAFRDNPHRWFIRTDSKTALAIWALIVKRQAEWDAKHPPTDRLDGTLPLILYFKTAEDRDEMIAAIKAAKPNMVETKVL